VTLSLSLATFRRRNSHYAFNSFFKHHHNPTVAGEGSCSSVSIILRQAPNEMGAIGQLTPPRNFYKRMYLYGAAPSYITLPPKKNQLVAALFSGLLMQRQTN